MSKCIRCLAEAIEGRLSCQEHLDKLAANARAFRKANPKYGRTGIEAWQNENRIRVQWSGLKTKARRRGLPVSITFEEYQLLHSHGCAYCGNSLPEFGHGIDRLDHRKGYVTGNVVPCCSRCNQNKGRLEVLGFVYPRTVVLLRELLDAPAIANPLPHVQAVQP